MGKRSGLPDHDEDLEKLPLEELNAEIARVTSRLSYARTKYSKKSLFGRLIWLEAFRERKHGVPAPKRVMRARSS
jgi:hypothetical protein